MYLFIFYLNAENKKGFFFFFIIIFLNDFRGWAAPLQKVAP